MISLLESLNLYKMEVLIKTSTSINKVHIYNQIRALKGVVVCSVEQNEFLDSKKTDRFEYSLLHIKYIVNTTSTEDMKVIKNEALIANKIEGLLQFIPRYSTTIKKGDY